MQPQQAASAANPAAGGGRYDQTQWQGRGNIRGMEAHMDGRTIAIADHGAHGVAGRVVGMTSQISREPAR